MSHTPDPDPNGSSDAGHEKTLTMQMGMADLIAALAHRERQIEAIRRTSDVLFSHPSVDSMIQATLKVALDVLRAEAGTVFLHDPTDDTLVFRYVTGGGGESLIGQRIPASQGIVGSVFRSGRAAITSDVHTQGDFDGSIDQRTGFYTQSMMSAPIKRTAGAPIGVMQVLNARIPFTEADREVLEVLCAQAATGIEHATLVEEARKAQIVNVIGDISHDIKNMLTPIITGVWTLQPMLQRLFEDLDAVQARLPQGEPLTEELARAADAVRHDYGWILESAVNAAEQVQGRTKEIADAVKGELSPPLFEMGDLNETCHQVVYPLRTVAERGGVRLVLDLDETLPEVEFDRRQMYNALYNLVNNALPETPQGGTVTLRTRRPVAPSDTIAIEVRDTGRGMPPDVRERLFTDQAVSTKPGGTGLGTRIVAGVIRRHHGTITVESAPGKGTAFTIRLPLRQVPSGA